MGQARRFAAHTLLAGALALVFALPVKAAAPPENATIRPLSDVESASLLFDLFSEGPDARLRAIRTFRQRAPSREAFRLAAIVLLARMAMAGEEDGPHQLAFDAMARIDPKATRAGPALLLSLRALPDDVRRRLILGRLLEFLRKPHPELQRQIVDALSELVSESAEADREAPIQSLLPLLSAKRKELRRAVVSALSNIGPSSKPEQQRQIVDALVRLLEDEREPEVQSNAVAAIGRHGSEARRAIQPLLKLWDKFPKLRGDLAEAFVNLGPVARDAIGALRSSLRPSSPIELRVVAAKALGSIGPDAKDAVPELQALLKHNPEPLRLAAVEALGRIGPQAETACQALMELLSGSPELRERAIEALARIGGAETVRLLSNVVQDSGASATTRKSAIRALHGMGARAHDAIPFLVGALDDPEVRAPAAAALATIAMGLKDTRDIERLPALRTARTRLRQIAPPPGPAAPGSDREVVRRSLDGLEDAVAALEMIERAGRMPFAWRVALILLAVASRILLAVASLLLVWVAVLGLRPGWLLAVSDRLDRLDERLRWLIPQPVSQRLRELLAHFNYRPRALDTWVARHVGAARASFDQSFPRAHDDNVILLPLAHPGPGTASFASPRQLAHLFRSAQARVLISGGPETGKTCWASHLGRAAMHDRVEERLRTNPMIVVLLDRDTKPLGGDDSLIHVLQRKLALVLHLARPPRWLFVRALLRHQRLLVILDGLSEMTSEMRALVRRSFSAFDVNALLITSREGDLLEGLAVSALAPRALEPQHLARHVERYLSQLFAGKGWGDSALQAIAQKVLHLLGGRPCSALVLARLCAESLLHAPAEGLPSLPDNVPDLVLGHVRRLCARPGEGPGDGPDPVMRDVQAVAWACLASGYRHSPSPRSHVLAELGNLPQPEGTGEARLTGLQAHAGLLHGPGDDTLAFTTDLLAEYLAGMHLVENYKDDLPRWQEFFKRLPRDQAPAAQNFLLAVRDCCLVRHRQAGLTDFVLHQLAELTVPERVLLGWVRRELQEARDQMTAIFPPRGNWVRPGALVGHRHRHATTVSGDCYNFFDRTNGLGIYAVDCEGHGLAAASEVRALYQALASRERWGQGDVCDELAAADRMVRDGALYLHKNNFFCMSLTAIDVAAHKVRFANAGMPTPLLLFRRRQGTVDVLEARGRPLGNNYRNPRTPPTRAEADYEDGDLLVLYSDGISEAPDPTTLCQAGPARASQPKACLFGRAGVIDTVWASSNRPPEAIADEVLWAAAQHARALTPRDDQTVIVVALGEGFKGDDRLTSRVLLPVSDDTFHLRHSGPATVEACQHQLRPLLFATMSELGFGDERRRQQVWTATWEALQNGLQHATQPGEVLRVRLSRPCQREGWLRVEVNQPRPWRSGDLLLSHATERIRTQQRAPGGTIVMQWLADEVELGEQERTIGLLFSPAVKAERRVPCPSGPLHAPGEGGQST